MFMDQGRVFASQPHFAVHKLGWLCLKLGVQSFQTSSRLVFDPITIRCQF